MRTILIIRKIGLQGSVFVALAMCCCGCTSLSEYIHNGFKVGPNYRTPDAPVASSWIDASDPEKRVRTEADDLLVSKWWTVFNDPVLNDLICDAYHQNLTLKEAGYRVLQARAQLGIAVGEFFPQTQAMNGDFLRQASSGQTGNGPQKFSSRWDYGFALSWELDFWGKYRRAIESNRASLQASVADYDDVLVTLLGDLATAYVTYRTAQERIRYATENAKIQADLTEVIRQRNKVGKVAKIDLDQSESTLYQTQAGIPALEITLRTANNQMCILLGIPMEALRAKLGPTATYAKPAFDLADADGDGKLSRQEFRAAADQLFKACDRGGNGVINEKDLAEGIARLLPSPLPGPARDAVKVFAVRVFQRSDTDKDGKLSLEGFLRAADKFFQDADRPKKGSLDANEFFAAINELVATIPVAPSTVAVGIPADLLRRRPDVRQAERLAAAQCAQIGVAVSDFYPHISINGIVDYQAARFKDLFNPKALSGSFGPSFQWDILQYGRLLNNVRLQDATFLGLVEAYKQSVLNANQEVENGLVTFLKSQEQYKLQKKSVDAGKSALDTVQKMYPDNVDFTRVAQLLQTQVVLEDTLAQVEGQIATGLISVYAAMGGGWEIRLNGCTPSAGEAPCPVVPPPEMRDAERGRMRPRFGSPVTE
jgi:outer membrane protein TolC